MAGKINILSTASLDPKLREKAAARGVELDVVPFIKITAIANDELEERVVDLCYVEATVVFTSMNAVKAVSDIILTADPSWDVYCIGNATVDAVRKQFHSATVVGVAENAAELADIIIKDVEEEVVFFCGNRRMDTLPALLRKHDIEVYEVVVYQTIETPVVVEKEYDGVLFFSPSAVSSFFSVNKIGPVTVLFAIGSTTANAIKQYTDNKVVFSETAGKDAVMEYAIKYFDKK